MGKNTMNGCRVNWLAALFSLVLARGRGRGGGGVLGYGGGGVLAMHAWSSRWSCWVVEWEEVAEMVFIKGEQ